MTTCIVASLALLYPNLSTQSGPKPLMRDFIGINTHTVQFDSKLYKPVAKLIRNYHPVAWDLDGNPSNPPQFPTTREKITWKKFSDQVNWDTLYNGWKKDGYQVLASMMFESMKPDKWTDIKKDGFTYAKAFAERYGPSGKFKSVESLEIGNEPVEYSDAQYREMYESMAKGIRAADPKMLIATCAVAVGNKDRYSKDINILKGLEGLIDVLNVHVYSFEEHWPTWKRSHPEDPKIEYLKQVQNIIDWRDKNALGRKVWVTEFGYDSTTKPNHKEGDFAKWVGVSDTVQAQWLVRSFLVFAGMNVDRAYMYWFNDEDAPTLHAASGLTRNFEPKPSYYAQSHLLKTLGNYRFEKALTQKNGDAYAYQFAAERGRDKIVVGWSPTGSERKGTVSVPAPGYKIVKSEKMPLKIGAAPSAGGSIDSQGNLTLPIDESPSYVWLTPR